MLAAGVGVLALLAFVVYLGPVWLVGRHPPASAFDRLRAENDVRATLLQAVGGLVLLCGLYFTGRTFQLNREGQVTERFTRAIEQLGHENLDVRLGGIYALERIAKSSQRDHSVIVEILTAFVREHQRWKADQAPEASGEGAAEESEKERLGAVAAPRGDVQAVLTVLGRRRREWDSGQPLDLRASDLRGYSLAGAHFEGADLTGAHLEHANLSNARLQQARLNEASLHGALLQETQLAGASLNRADLAHAYVNGSDLRGVDLSGASLDGAHFGLVTLAGAFLGMTTFRGATLQWVDLTGTSLTAYHLDGAWIDDPTKLPALPPIDGRIWLADRGTSIKLITVLPPGEQPPNTDDLPELKYGSGFVDATDSFRFQDETPAPPTA